MAFSLTRKGLVAYPLLYGMVVFARMLGPGAQLIPLHLAAPAALHLKAWAVRLNGGVMHVLLLDKRGRPVRVRIALPFTGTATVQLLTAPKVTSTGQVTLGNQHLTRAATWAGTPRAETVAPTTTGYLISVPSYSTALVTAAAAGVVIAVQASPQLPIRASPKESTTGLQAAPAPKPETRFCDTAS